METHSSVLAWRIPGMGEPGGLPSRTYFPVLYSRTLLFIHSLYNSLQLLVLTSQSFPHTPWVCYFRKGGQEGLWVEGTVEQEHGKNEKGLSYRHPGQSALVHKPQRGLLGAGIGSGN